MAPFHDGSQADYIRALGYLENHVGMLATSTALAEAPADRRQKQGRPATFAVGLSLGGSSISTSAYFGKTMDRCQ